MRAQTARATQQNVAQPLSQRAFLVGLGAGATLLLVACEQQEQSADSSPRGPISAPTQVPAARAVVHPPRGDESGKPTPQELARAERWFAEAFQSPKRILPLAFRYGERDSTAFLAGWRAEWIQDATVAGVTHARLTLTDPATSLQCQCAITTFADFPAVEWVVSFANTGAVSSPILADIQPLDAIFPFNLGLPEARKYLTAQISEVIGSGGVIGYRQDFNINPAPFWDAADAADRVGMTDIRSFDSDFALQASGGDLLKRGFPIEVGERPGLALLLYKCVV